MDDLVFFGGSCSGVGSVVGGKAVMKEVRIYHISVSYKVPFPRKDGNS